VWLITDSSWTEADAKRIAAGCEEEGVPLAWDVRQGEAADLARTACLSSHLEVGIGLDAVKSAAIALVNVSDRPYVTEVAEGAEKLRWIGQAAARISKSQPVPELREPSKEKNEKIENNSARGRAITKTAQPPASPPHIDIAEIIRTVMNELKNKQEGGAGGYEQR